MIPIDEINHIIIKSEHDHKHPGLTVTMRMLPF